MKNRHLIVVPILCFFLFSCKKEQNISFVNAEFIASSITKEGTLKVFGQGGKIIDDPTVVSGFTAGEQTLLSLEQTLPAGERVKFISADSVYFLSANGTIYQKYAYKREGTKIFFSETHIEFEGHIDTYVNHLYKSIVKYAPVLSENNASPRGGLYSYRNVTTTAIGYLSQTELKIDQFAFKYKTVYTDGAWRSNGGVLMNQFNDQFPQTLTAQNTLAIQAYVLNFRRSK